MGSTVFLVYVLSGHLEGCESGVSKWKATALMKIDALSPDPSVDEVMKVAGYVGVAARGDEMTDEHREVVEKVRAKIFGLPEHGRFFREAIERAIQNEFLEVSDPSSAPTVAPKRWWVFDDLCYLPSPQIVALLGQLLEDDRDPWKGQPAPDYNLPHPNSYLAAKSLNRIGIEGVPVIEPIRDDRDYEAARDQWKLWFAQVKAGNRTFRFKGDPQEYSLDGPVASVPVVNVERRGGQAADPSPAAGAAVGSRKPVWIPLAVAILVLGVAFARWARGRRTA